MANVVAQVPGGRRAVAALVMTGVAALAAAGCGGGSATPGRPSAAGGAPTRGGTLTVARAGDIDSLDPSTSTIFTTTQSLDLVYDRLTALDAKLHVVPSLATSYATGAGGRTLTFTLRSGVRFRSGAPLTSADVKASLQRLLDPKTGSPAASNLATVKAIGTPDAQTVVLKLSAPSAALPAALADPSAAIFSRADLAKNIIKRATDGTGPYTVASWQPNRQLVLERNATYWGKRPYLDKLVFRVIPDESSVVSALQSGSADFAVLTDPVVAKGVVANPAFRTVKTPDVNYHALMLQARRKPLDDRDVRLAISCAIDRKQVLDAAALGQGSIVGPITIPAFASDPASRPCPSPDLAKAKQLLAQSGHAGGLTLDTIVSQGVYATSVNEAQNLQAQLAKVGVKLKLEVLESTVYDKRWLAGDFDAAVALNGGKADPDTMYGRYFTTKGSLNPVAGYHDATLDRLFAQGAATAEAAQRRPIYGQISQRLEDQAAWVWLFSAYDYASMKPAVNGFVGMPTGSLQYLRQTYKSAS